MPGMSEIREGRYILATGVVVIANDNTDGTNINNNKAMANVSSINSGNNVLDNTILRCSILKNIRYYQIWTKLCK